MTIWMAKLRKKYRNSDERGFYQTSLGGFLVRVVGERFLFELRCGAIVQIESISEAEAAS